MIIMRHNWSLCGRSKITQKLARVLSVHVLLIIFVSHVGMSVSSKPNRRERGRARELKRLAVAKYEITVGISLSRARRTNGTPVQGLSLNPRAAYLSSSVKNDARKPHDSPNKKNGTFRTWMIQLSVEEEFVSGRSALRKNWTCRGNVGWRLRSDVL